MSRPAELDASTAETALDNLACEISLAEHLCDLIDRIAADELSLSDTKEEFLRQKNVLSALARSVARTLRTVDAEVAAVREVLPPPASTRLKGASHAA